MKASKIIHRNLVLQRLFTLEGSTIGVIHGLPFPMFTLEDEWRGNLRNISSIPSGTYTCKPHGWEENTPFRFKRTWQLQNVPNRSAILIHAGNTHENTQGCILVGLTLSASTNKVMIGQSRDAMDKLREHLGETDFTIQITGQF